MKQRTRIERLNIILDISKRLKAFPKSTYLTTEIYMDLYNADYIAIKKIKKIFKEYINQDDTKPEMLIGMSGSISFPEIERKIEYILPIDKKKDSVFIMKYQKY